MRAIISVSDKQGVEAFAKGLMELAVEVFSTGGTQRSLEAAGVKVKSISQLTGFPEILGGRVKTLHPAVHGGILARRDLPQHLTEIAKHGISPIDLVVVNLYPFKETVARGASWEEALENIDIGGPTLIRAAAKNFPWVLVVVDPQDYDPILSGLRQGEISLEERKKLAYKAFQHVALYDSVIAQYLWDGGESWPETMTIALKKSMELRYGENPHQRAAFYLEENLQKPHSLLQAQKLTGKELSYNNILDLEAAIASVRPFSAPTVAVIKHNNPCGLACHADLAEAYRRALAGDPVAAFGGVVALNRPIDPATADEINKTHFDIIIAPSFSPQAQALLGRKRNLILLALAPFPSPPPWEIKRAGGAFLLQTPDIIETKEFQPKAVTLRQPTSKEKEDLFFAWRVVKEVKSNAIVLAQDEALLGMGAGQPSRVVSVELALKRAGTGAKGSVLASDAFFPFPDGVELVGQAGVTAIIQPGGSLRDEEVIATANKYNMAMVFTGNRHFKH